MGKSAMELTTKIVQTIDYRPGSRYGIDYGFGDGYGHNGYGYSWGSGEGSGDDVSGEESGEGYGDGDGSGYGSSYYHNYATVSGSGGSGSGYGYGDGSFLILLARFFYPAIKITFEWLRNRGACSDQVDLFDTTFSDGAEPTPENLEHAQNMGLEISWLLRFVDKLFTLEEEVNI